MNKKIRFGRFFALATLVLLLATLAITAVKLLHREVDAITQNDAMVKIVREDKTIHYGPENKATHRYLVYSPVEAQSYFLAYCANPDKDSPTNSPDGDEFPAEALNSSVGRDDHYDEIKLLIYVSTINNEKNKQIMNNLFPEIDPDESVDIGGSDQRYALIHAVIGYLYEGCTTGICPGGNLLPEIANIPNQIQELIQDNDESWIIAKNYQLFRIKQSYMDDTHPNKQNIVWIEDAATYGNLTVKKCDSEGSTDTECRGPRDGTNFDGITFTLYNKTGDAILWNNRVYNNHAAMATYTLENGNDTVTFENLPIGEYQVAEGGNNDYYTVTAPNQTTDVTSNNAVLYFRNDFAIDISLDTTAADADDDKFILASSESTIKDTVNYCLLPNQSFTIHGWLVDKATKKPIMDDNGDIIESNEVVRVGNKPCYKVEMQYEFDSTKLAGQEIVVFVEAFYGDGASVEDPELIAEHKDINDADQTVYIISLETYAGDVDGGKEIVADEKAKIIDVMSYCLVKGQKFTVSGILMDKKTEKPILIGGETVEQTIELEVEDEACSESEMVFEFDATEFADSDIVVFTYVYNDDDTTTSKPILPHADFTNLDQTVHIVPKTPDTGLSIRQSDSGSESSMMYIGVSIAALSIAAYVGARVYSKRSFLYRSR